MTGDRASDEVLARYVPRLLLDRLATADARRADGPPERLDVAALWVDISGFTPLTRSLAAQGVRGAEIVTGVLNRCFGELIDRVLDAGGDLVDFGGDGLLAVWPSESGGGPRLDGLRQAVLRAVRCAEGIQAEMDRFPATADATLRFYAAIGAGEVVLLDVGGVEDRWRFVVAGDPLSQMSRAGDQCEAGEIVLSPEALVLVAEDVGVKERGGGFGVVRSSGDAASAAGTSSPTGSPPREGSGRVIERGDSDLLRSYVLDTVLERVDAGQTDWLAELRIASVVFFVVPDPDVETEGGRRALGTAVREAQQRIRALDGGLNQVMMDDNGFVLLLAWGVPGHTHEDDARRALQASMEIRERIVALGLEPRVGVATGELFCGSYGNARRQRYALVGSVVNRSARIAMASRSAAQCDGRTRQAAADRLELVDAGMLTLKGIAEPVRIFRPTGAAKAGRGAQVAEAVAGRVEERAVLGDALESVLAGEGPPLLFIEGEAGIGKSVLLGHLVAGARAAGMRPLVGAADAVERSTAYFPFREPIRALLAVDPDDPPEEHRARVAEIVDALPEHAGRAPLLEPVLGLGFEDNELTAAMAGADRGIATREVLVDLLDELGGPTPVLALDDLHWFDSASLALILAVRARVPRALVAVATRPAEGDAWSRVGGIAEIAGTVRIPLVAMEGAGILEMVRRSLHVDEVPEGLAEFLIDRGEGHPLFTVELALLLREMGVVRIESGRCHFDPEDERLSVLRFSDRAHGVVATRIDQLAPSHQLALKVASVVGRSFAFRLVRDVHPIEDDRARLRRILDDLIEPRLLEEERPDPALTYLFRHVVIREVAYGLVAFAQRRRLHADVARSIEASEEGGQPGTFPLLAHHWRMAEEHGPAIEYLRRSGVEALRRGAGREALRFFSDAFDLSEAHRPDLPDVTETRLADLERLMGAALEQLHDVEGSSRHLRRALERLGHTVHGAESAGRRRELLKQIAVQVGHLFRPSALRWRPSSERAEALELAARAFGTYAEHRYFESDILGMVLASLTSVNLAERAGTPAAAERSYVTLAHSAGLAGIEPLVRRYRARSADTTLGRNRAFRDIELAGRLLARGRSEEAAAAGERAAHLARRYADRYGEAQGWGCVAMSMLQLGRADETAEAGRKMIPTGQTDWAMSARCAACVYAGRPQGALERFATTEEVEPAFEFGHLVAQTLWAEEEGEWERAVECADRTLAFAESPGVKNAFISVHYADLLAFYSRLDARLARSGAALSGLEPLLSGPLVRSSGLDAPVGADAALGRDAVLARVRRLHRELRGFSRIFRIGRPIRERAAMMIAAREGRGARALRHLVRGLRQAEEMALRPETVLLHLAAARSGVGDVADHLARATKVCRDHALDRLLLEVEEVGRGV